MEFTRSVLFDFHGVQMTKYFTENWENIQNFQARPDDILIATYPKAGQCIWVAGVNDLSDKRYAKRWVVELYDRARSVFFVLGTTWVSVILDLLYFGKTAPERQTSIPIYERVPFLEITFPSMDSGWTDGHTCILFLKSVILFNLQYIMKECITFYSNFSELRHCLWDVHLFF